MTENYAKKLEDAEKRLPELMKNDEETKIDGIPVNAWVVRNHIAYYKRKLGNTLLKYFE